MQSSCLRLPPQVSPLCSCTTGLTGLTDSSCAELQPFKSSTPTTRTLISSRGGRPPLPTCGGGPRSCKSQMEASSSTASGLLTSRRSSPSPQPQTCTRHPSHAAAAMMMRTMTSTTPRSASCCWTRRGRGRPSSKQQPHHALETELMQMSLHSGMPQRPL